MAYCADDQYRKSLYCLQEVWKGESETENEIRARKAIKKVCTKEGGK